MLLTESVPRTVLPECCSGQPCAMYRLSSVLLWTSVMHRRTSVLLWTTVCHAPSYLGFILDNLCHVLLCLGVVWTTVCYIPTYFCVALDNRVPRTDLLLCYSGQPCVMHRLTSVLLWTTVCLVPTDLLRCCLDNSVPCTDLHLCCSGQPCAMYQLTSVLSGQQCAMYRLTSVLPRRTVYHVWSHLGAAVQNNVPCNVPRQRC
jgi:hypothetical protein